MVKEWRDARAAVDARLLGDMQRLMDDMGEGQQGEEVQGTPQVQLLRHLLQAGAVSPALHSLLVTKLGEAPHRVLEPAWMTCALMSST